MKRLNYFGLSFFTVILILQIYEAIAAIFFQFASYVFIILSPHPPSKNPQQLSTYPHRLNCKIVFNCSRREAIISYVSYEKFFAWPFWLFEWLLSTWLFVFRLI